MKDTDCVQFLQDVLPEFGMWWPGFRKVRRQVCKRLDRRLRNLGLEDVSAYREYLNCHAAEWSVLDAMCRISISRFYRDRGVFDLLRNRLLPQLAAAAVSHGDCIRAWCAGCASGEEPYTLKMIWDLGVQEQFPNQALHITATDAEPKMLDRARRGRYERSSVKDFPNEWITLAFNTIDHEFSVNPRFRDGIDFWLQDIRREQPPGPFDLILCRHLVFTYFNKQVQNLVLKQMTDRLRSNGILVIGKQEPLAPETHTGLQMIEPGIYRWCPLVTT